MYLQGMKEMYEWIHMMTKGRLSPDSLYSYVLTKADPSDHSILVRSDRIGRSITPRPQSSYYSSHSWYSSSFNTSPAISRPGSTASGDLHYSMRYNRGDGHIRKNTTRSNIYPDRHTTSVGISLANVETPSETTDGRPCSFADMMMIARKFCSH